MVSNFLGIIKSAFLIVILLLSTSRAGLAQSLAIVNGRASYLAKPEYPREAEEFCADGEVRVRITAKNGRVASAKPVFGDELLQLAAVDAARKARFDPYPSCLPGRELLLTTSGAICGSQKAANARWTKIR